MLKKASQNTKNKIVKINKLHKQVSGKLFYADDTIIMAKTAEAVVAMQHRIEEESHRYALKLNQNKCIHIRTHECDTLNTFPTNSS